MTDTPPADMLRHAIRRHVRISRDSGYLPDHVLLFAGTISQWSGLLGLDHEPAPTTTGGMRAHIEDALAAPENAGKPRLHFEASRCAWNELLHDIPNFHRTRFWTRIHHIIEENGLVRAGITATPAEWRELLCGRPRVPEHEEQAETGDPVYMPLRAKILERIGDAAALRARDDYAIEISAPLPQWKGLIGAMTDGEAARARRYAVEQASAGTVRLTVEDEGLAADLRAGACSCRRSDAHGLAQLLDRGAAEIERLQRIQDPAWRADRGPSSPEAIAAAIRHTRLAPRLPENIAALLEKIAVEVEAIIPPEPERGPPDDDGLVHFTSITSQEQLRRIVSTSFANGRQREINDRFPTFREQCTKRGLDPDRTTLDGLLDVAHEEGQTESWHEDCARLGLGFAFRIDKPTWDGLGEPMKNQVVGLFGALGQMLGAYQAKRQEERPPSEQTVPHHRV